MDGNVKRMGIFIASILCCSGCATIISGTSQVMTFQSSPTGAEVFVNGVPVGVTPLTVTVARRKGTKVLIQKHGYREQTFVLKTKLEPWFWGNVVVGGLLGSTTDAATGATVEYSPDQYYTVLEAIAETPSAQAMGVMANTRNQVIRFVLVNYNNLASDMNAGSGEYLTALFDLLEVPAGERRAALPTVKALFVQKPGISDFAEAVADAFQE